jgi:hypothetical protein
MVGLGTYTVTDSGDAIQFHGVDVGGGMNPKRVVQRSRDYVALHIPGHRRWGGNFQPQIYEPASFMIIRKTNDTTAELIISFPKKS